MNYNIHKRDPKNYKFNYFSRFRNNEAISSEEFTAFLQSQQLPKLRYLRLFNVPESFDIEAFIDFSKVC